MQRRNVVSQTDWCLWMCATLANMKLYDTTRSIRGEKIFYSSMKTSRRASFFGFSCSGRLWAKRSAASNAVQYTFIAPLLPTRPAPDTALPRPAFGLRFQPLWKSGAGIPSHTLCGKNVVAAESSSSVDSLTVAILTL